MNNSTSTNNYLLEKYGPLMTRADLAEVTKKTIESINYALSCQRDQEWVVALLAAKITIGRRIYFSTEMVAEMITPPRASPAKSQINKDAAATFARNKKKQLI